MAPLFSCWFVIGLFLFASGLFSFAYGLLPAAYEKSSPSAASIIVLW